MSPHTRPNENRSGNSSLTAALRDCGVPAVLCGLGCGIAIYVMQSSSALTEYPMAAIPFATSIVLVISQPHAVPAQPRALVGGHVIAALVGLCVLALTGPGSVAAAVAVALAVLAMMLTDTLHPPAGISPLLVVTGNLPWSFLVAPVLVGALMLLGFALVWHRLALRQSWPERWL